MNKKIIYVAIALAVAISAAAFVFSKKSYSPGESSAVMNSETEGGAAGSSATPGSSAPSASSEDANQASSSSTSSPPPSSGPSLPVNDAAGSKASKWAEVPLSAKEIKSVRVMSATLVKFLDPKMGNPDLLVKEFNKAGMQAVMAKDFNQYTGKMIVVRCNNPPPGTRCCHAQYFEDENKKSFLQHMSFEVRPGKGAMEQVISSLEEALKPLKLGKLEKPVSKTEDKVHWELQEDYTATIKKLSTADDLKNDPFCAHDPEEDKDSYKVMVEMAPDDDHD
ncbi:MAG: hypothetical protein AB7K68_03940 [Bacteriovoracia bacterium]